jgi:hypothetical protein
MSVKQRTQLMLEAEQHRQLRLLAQVEGKSVSQLVREAVTQLLDHRLPLPITEDPIWEIVTKGTESAKALIDDIPVSEDPELYYVADLMARKRIGPYAEERETPPHAWEIAPRRYIRGEDGRPVRIGGASP